MFIKRALLGAALSLLCITNTYAQKTDFCDAVSAILKDGPNEFKNIRHPDAERSGGNGLVYKSNINVPGSIISRFVASMGLFYEGALKQAPTTDLIKPEYNRIIAELNSCLVPKGYVMRSVPNYIKGLESFKKIMFMPDFKATTPPVGHVTLEVDYNKDSKQYTLILYIFQK